MYWKEQTSLAVLLENAQNLKLRTNNDPLQTDTEKNLHIVIRALLFGGIIPERLVGQEQSIIDGRISKIRARQKRRNLAVTRTELFFFSWPHQAK